MVAGCAERGEAQGRPHKRKGKRTWMLGCIEESFHFAFTVFIFCFAQRNGMAFQFTVSFFFLLSNLLMHRFEGFV